MSEYSIIICNIDIVRSVLHKGKGGIAMKTFTKKIFLDWSQNGLRRLFDFNVCQLLERKEDETKTYYILNSDTNKFFEIDFGTCYELLPQYLSNLDDRKHLLRNLKAIESSVLRSRTQLMGNRRLKRIK